MYYEHIDGYFSDALNTISDIMYRIRNDDECKEYYNQLQKICESLKDVGNHLVNLEQCRARFSLLQQLPPEYEPKYTEEEKKAIAQKIDILSIIFERSCY